MSERAEGCECVGYTIRTDYGTGIEYDVDTSDCPVHGGCRCQESPAAVSSAATGLADPREASRE